MVDLMSLGEQVEKDFSVARRRAWTRRLKAMISGGAGAGDGTLLDFYRERKKVGANGGVRRGRSAVEVSRIVGSAGKYAEFDEGFMPLGRASAERWKRIDRAFRLGQELPAVSLYRIGDRYFVQDGHNRVSVARFHGAEWIDAEVTGFGLRPPSSAMAHAAHPIFRAP
jgi:hypothetical protein